MNKSHAANVSVVMPCYRCADTIERAVVSVDAQTLKPAEVILVDDFSNDGTLEVLYELQRRFPERWIKVIAVRKNGGPGEARNVGWGAAAHDYIAFLDADDSWHPQKIEIQYRWMNDHPCVALTGHDCLQRSGTKKSRDEIFLIDNVPSHQVSKASLLIRNQFSTPSVMLKRSIQQRFAKGKRYSEDYLLWLEIMFAGHRVAKIDLPLAYLYKAPYGEGGLSAQLWKMECGEIDAYRRLRSENCMLFSTYLFLDVWSWLRFIRRLVLARFRS